MLSNIDDNWAEIKDFPDYMVSRYGQVYSKRSNKILKPLKSIDGYVCFALTRNKKRYNVNLQRIVAEAFIPNPDNKTCVHHINGDITDNVWTNLVWGYRSDSEKFLDARSKSGNKRKGRKLSNEQLEKIRKSIQENQGIKVIQYTMNGEFVAKYNSYGEAMRLTGVDDNGIGACCSGKQKHAGGYIWKPSPEDENLRKIGAHKKYIAKGLKVNQYTLDGEFVATYKNCNEAYRFTGANPANISKCCFGKAHTVGGYIWKFADTDSE
jgi:hypothetical protein